MLILLQTGASIRNQDHSHVAIHAHLGNLSLHKLLLQRIPAERVALRFRDRQLCLLALAPPATAQRLRRAEAVSVGRCRAQYRFGNYTGFRQECSESADGCRRFCRFRWRCLTGGFEGIPGRGVDVLGLARQWGRSRSNSIELRAKNISAKA